MKQEFLEVYGNHFYNLGLNIAYTSHKINPFNLAESNRLKAPAIEYRKFFTQRQSEDEFKFNMWEDAMGLGLILGHDGIMAIDVDGCVDFSLIDFICDKLGIPKNYNWIIKSGSHCGFHIVLKCSNRPKTTGDEYSFGQSNVDAFYPTPINYFSRDSYTRNRRDIYNKSMLNEHFNENYSLRTIFQKIEFGWNGFLVLPPSLHQSGLRYEFLNSIPSHPPVEVDFEKLKALRKLIASEKRSISTIEDQGTANWIQVIQNYDENTDTEMIFFDLETNGLPKDFSKDYTQVENFPEILQLAWIVVNSNLSTIRKESYLICKPDKVQLDTGSQKIHGLNLEMLNLIGTPIKKVLEKFLKDIQSCKGKIISHNFEFDSKIILAELIKNGLNERIFMQKENDCTMKSYVDLYSREDNAKYPKLEELYFHLFAKEIPTKHNAIYDAIVCKICYEKMFGIFNSNYLP